MVKNHPVKVIRMFYRFSIRVNSIRSTSGEGFRCLPPLSSNNMPNAKYIVIYYLLACNLSKTQKPFKKRFQSQNIPRR